MVAEYDPKKRRERYLRTRELKGRKKGTAPKEAVKESAAAQRKRINDQLRSALQKLTSDAKQAEKDRTKERDAKLEKIAADRLAKLALVPEVPANVSSQTKARYQKRRDAMVARITKAANTETAKVRSEYADKQRTAANELNKTKRFVQAVSKAQQDQLRSKLQKSVKDAKQRYDDKRKDLG